MTTKTFALCLNAMDVLAPGSKRYFCQLLAGDQPDYIPPPSVSEVRERELSDLEKVKKYSKKIYLEGELTDLAIAQAHVSSLLSKKLLKNNVITTENFTESELDSSENLGSDFMERITLSEDEMRRLKQLILRFKESQGLEDDETARRLEISATEYKETVYPNRDRRIEWQESTLQTIASKFGLSFSDFRAVLRGNANGARVG